MNAIAVARRALAFAACVALTMISEGASAKTNVQIEGDTLVVHVPIEFMGLNRMVSTCPCSKSHLAMKSVADECHG